MRIIEYEKKSRILLILLIALFMQLVLPTHAYAHEEDNKQETILVEEPSIIDGAIKKEDGRIVTPSNNVEKQEGKEIPKEKEASVDSLDQTEESKDKDIVDEIPTKSSAEENEVETPQEEAPNDLNKQEGKEVPKEIEASIDSLVQTEESKDKDIVDEIPTKSSTEENEVDGSDAIINNDDIKDKEVKNTKDNPTKAGDESPTDLTSYITRVTINADKDANGNYIVRAGDNYAVTMCFAEEPGHQFNNHETLSYKLPEKGFDDFVNQQGTFSITVDTTDQGTVTITGNQYRIEGGILYIDWSTTDPNISVLFSANNAEFDITFNGSFDGSKTTIEYNDSVITPLVFDQTESHISMTKSSETSTQNGNSVINYTIVITSTGINTDVNVDDILSGTGVNLDHSSFKVLPDSFTNGITFDEENSNKFHFHADRLSNGQVVTITYSALLDERFAQTEGEGENKKFYINANNQATIKSKEETPPPPPPTNNTVYFKPYISKVGMLLDGSNRILWNVSINVNNKLLIKDMPVVDTIDPSSVGIMSYDTNTDFIVKIYNSAGRLIKTENVSWSQVLNAAQTGWTYTIPSNDDHYRYEIEYATTYQDVPLDTTLKNKVDIGDNESSSGIDIEGYADIDINKKATLVDPVLKEVTWEITIDVPTVGLNSTNNILTEKYPYRYINGRNVYEKLKSGTVNVVGLTGSEYYTVNYSDTEATIAFYKDAQTPGLNGTGSKRQIIVTLKTEINDEWLNQVDSSTEFISHTNTITMGDKTRYGIAFVSHSTLQKNILTESTVTIDGVKYPCYTYQVLFGQIDEENITLEDSFDTSVFGIYNPDGDLNVLVVGGGDSIYNQTNVAGGWNNARKINYTETNTGVTFAITPDNLAKREDGSLYNYYSFNYYLMPKNLESLRTLMQRAAASNGAYNFDNIIKYEDELEAKTTGTYYYNALSKKQTSEYNSQTGTVDFEIEINPDQLVLNDGNTITLTDTYNNMSIVYDSIVVTPSTDVVYDASGNIITFTLPDAKKVTITYTARIVFNTNSSEVEYYNVAALIAGNSVIEKDVTGTAVQTSSGSGHASIYNINLLKYEAGNMAHRLAGAVFELLDANKQDIINKNGEKVYFTTDSEGKINIKGDEEIDGWSLSANTKYYIHETKAPEGYKLKTSYYEFTITKEGSPDYEHYIYLNGDILTVKNYPGTDIFVEKIWENGQSNHANDIVTVKLQEKVGEDGKWTDSDVAAISLSTANNWYGSFAGLPLVKTVGEEDLPVDYRVVEFLVNENPIEETEYTIEKVDNKYIITNKYSAKGEITFSGNKELKGRSIKEGEFTFVLLNEAGEELERVSNNANGTFTFTKIGYTLSDLGESETATKKYTIKEVAGTDASITYDKTEYAITVTLTDKGNGTIEAVSNPGSASFTFKNEYNAHVSVSKVDLLTGEEVEGATIQVLDKDGKIVDEWISTKKVHVVDGLNTNEKYTLIETIAPEGYKITEKVTFTIDENGKVTTTGHTSTDEEGNVILLVEDEKTIIRVTKVDINTKEEVAGAKLQIVDSKNNIVEEWISTKENHVIEGLKTGETYTLKEIVAPDGYKLTSDLTFTIDENGKVTTTGHTSTDEEGNVILLVEDEKTKVYISKVDIETGEDLAGAKIQILDSKGNIVETWTTTKEVHLVEGLKVNEEYTIRETFAPEGYSVAKDITFTIDENGVVTTTGNLELDDVGNTVLLVQDYKTPTIPPSENPQTADYFELYFMLFELFVLGFLGSIIHFRKLNKAQ